MRLDSGSDSLAPRPSANSPPASQADHLVGLIHWLSAAGRQLRRQLSAVAADCDLNDSELLVVWLCNDAGRVQVELAAAIGVSPAQMSGLVERLGRRGLVAMNRLASDRRRQVWKTSPAGLTLLAQVAAPLESLAAELCQSVAPHEQRLMRSLCERLAVAAAGARQPRDEDSLGKEAA